MKFYFRKMKIFFAATIVIFLAGCFQNYYKASKQKISDPNQKASVVDSLNAVRRYFILRNGPHAYYMKDVSLSEDRRSIQCTLDSLPSDHQLYLTRGRSGTMHYKPKNPDDIKVLNEVHFFVTPATSTTIGQYVLQLDNIQKIEVIQHDRGRTTVDYVLSSVGGVLGVIIVAAVIALATKSSCPFVSAYTGNDFELQGEIYGGAIYPQLARNDYMPLRMQPVANGKLMIKISNELREKQYTDVADLLVISHDKNSKVLADQKGNLYSISNASVPLKAWTSDKTDVLPLLIKSNDDQLLRFDDTLTASTDNYVITQFKNESHSSKAKLILSVKNSYWVDYLYTELAKKFGTYYSTYVKKQTKKPASELIQWAKDQHIPLEVSLKTKTGWEKITGLITIGPLATRELIVPLDLTNITDDNIEIKLSSGFMFWEIDYAAIDFSDDKYFSVQRISPSTAIDETGKNVLPELNKEDNNFLEQPVPGNVATLEYECSPQPENVSMSYILHTRGYYTHSWDFKDKPNFAFLKQLKKPGAFPSYSCQLYKKLVNTNLGYLTSK